jgi:hypothetical protein
MLTNSRYTDAIAGLHEKGYREDFVLFGDGLLWVQEKVFLRSNEFCILECLEIEHPAGERADLVIFGILDIRRNIKGILMNKKEALPICGRAPGV